MSIYFCMRISVLKMFIISTISKILCIFFYIYIDFQTFLSEFCEMMFFYFYFSFN